MGLKQRIYLDNAATTKLYPQVADLMARILREDFGNPSSVHAHGRKSKTLVEESRKKIAHLLNASTGEIFFTSCATESNNMVFHQCIEDLGIRRIISSKTEHPSVYNCLEMLKTRKDLEIIYLDVDDRGRISLGQLSNQLDSDTPTLVSLMHANNEIGTVLPIEEVSKICKDKGALFHSDVTQSLGKIPIDLQSVELYFLSASAHKFHGPKGVGILYVNSNNQIKPWVQGGGQERKMRSGTENIAGICGMATALQIACVGMSERTDYILKIREHLKSNLIASFNDVNFNGDHDGLFLHTILSVSFPLTPKTELLTFQLDIEGISASAGSACSSGTEKASQVLSAIKLPEDRKAVRFSFSHDNTIEEIDYLIGILNKVLQPIAV